MSIWSKRKHGPYGKFCTVMGWSVDCLLVVHSGFGKIMHNHNPSVLNSICPDRNIASRNAILNIKYCKYSMIKKYSNISYNTVTIELEHFQIDSLRISLSMKGLTYVSI